MANRYTLKHTQDPIKTTLDIQEVHSNMVNIYILDIFFKCGKFKLYTYE